jgi:hypothetical protein
MLIVGETNVGWQKKVEKIKKRCVIDYPRYLIQSINGNRKLSSRANFCSDVNLYENATSII